MLNPARRFEVDEHMKEAVRSEVCVAKIAAWAYHRHLPPSATYRHGDIKGTAFHFQLS